MKKTSMQIKEIVRDTVEAIYCDVCGRDFMLKENSFAGASMLAAFEYGSNKDGVDLVIDICDQCFDTWVDTFKHKPGGL